MQNLQVPSTPVVPALVWPLLVQKRPLTVFWSVAAAFLVTGQLPWQAASATDFLWGYGAGGLATYAQLVVATDKFELELLYAQMPSFVKAWL